MTTPAARRKRRWGTRGWVALIAFFIAGGCWVISHITARHAEVVAHQLARANERGSVARSVDTCRRTNPSRAYLQLRSQQLPKGSSRASRVTLTAAPEIFAILDCQRSVAEGRPVPLRDAVQREYLRLFEGGQVPIVRQGRIVSAPSFAAYFHAPWLQP